MRLTLRTLLAYLDDTLEPAEIKQIGQKVAESDAAQELIARIKQVTRKRRLTTPPLTGPGAKFDPNLIAEYLDNELTGEQVAEIEKICLESDVHLAEIAACHQILTLVLGEPALVPPTARERMYGLVKGREAIPFRKASAKNPTAVGKHNEEVEDTAVLGLPVHKRHAAWLKWAIPVAGLFLFLALGVALWTALSKPNPQVASNNNPPNKDIKEGDKENADKPAGDKANPEPDNKDKPVTDKDKTEKDKAEKDKAEKDKPAPDKDKPIEKDPPVKPPVAVWPTDRPKEPSKDRREVARFQLPRMGASSILVSRQREQENWSRVTLNQAVFSSDSLVSLPGYSSELRTPNGVRLLLWGTLPEFNLGSPMCPYMFESAITLHDNPQVDLEFTLERGRVYVSNHKENNKPALVRVRFGKEVWDLVLQEPETEIVLDLVTRYTDDINYLAGDEPLSVLALLVTKGTAEMKYDNYHQFPNLKGPGGDGPSFCWWTNKGAGLERPAKVDKDAPLLALLGKDPPNEPSLKAFQDFRPALDEVSNLLLDPKKSVDVGLLEGVDTGKFANQKALCIYCLGATDAVSVLLDILGKADPQSGRERGEAVIALRRWTCHGTQTANYLYDPKTESGLLLKKGYRTGEAKTLIELLYFQINESKAKAKETYQTLVGYLQHSKMPIRELAWYHLRQLTFGLKDLPYYDPSMSAEKREASARQWERLIADDKLPPKMMTPPK